jgi:putative DNA primase/helicase
VEVMAEDEKKKEKNKLSFNEIATYVLAGREGRIITDIDNDDIYIYDSTSGYWNKNHSNKLLEMDINSILSGRININLVKEVIACIKRNTYIDLSKKKSNHICLNNGLLNLDTLKVEPHNPDIFTTIKLDVDYNPNVDMTEWNNYTMSIQPDGKQRMSLQECCGNILDVNAYTLKKMLWLVGPGDSGKSTFLFILESFLGKRNVSNIPIHNLATSHENVKIIDKLANIGAEIVSDIKLRYVDTLKCFSGGDFIQFNPKFQQPFEAIPTAKHFYSSNLLPPVHKRADNVFYGRFEIIDFNQKFKKDDTIIKKYTTSEMKSCILNWLIDGYKRLKQNRWKLTYETAIDDIRSMFEYGSFTLSAIANWLIERCEKCTNPEIWYSTDDVYKNYVDYCEKKSKVQLSKNVFCRLLYSQQVYPVISYQPTVNGKQVYAIRGLELIL